jgi:polysaccharide biosynthesis protein PslH
MGGSSQARAGRAVIVTARFPWPPYTGDRLRSTHWIRALSKVMDVTLVAPAGSGAPSGVDHMVLRRSPSAGAAGIVELVRRGLPLHYAVAGGFDWKEAGRALESRGKFDVAIVMLTRVAAMIDPRRFANTGILDAVDALSASMRERASLAAWPLRSFWSGEALLTARHEREVSSVYDVVTVTAEAEAEALGGATVVPLGLDAGEPPLNGTRRFDFGFWGRLPYFANSDAVDVLLGEVWPRVRARMPDATLLIAGAQASGRIRRRHGIEGVHVISPMADRAAILREVEIALLPVRCGTGQSTKVLEAAEAGCSIVAMPRALRGQPDLPDSAVVMAPDPASLADAACRLREDRERMHEMRVAARRWLTDRCSMKRMLEEMRRVVDGAVGS